METLNSKWKLKRLFFIHLVVAILITTLFSPITQIFWKTIDIGFFKLINGSLENNKPGQIFWAFANHRYADWLEDICILIFFILCVKSVAKGNRTRKIAELLFLVLYAACLIYFINHLIFKKHSFIHRESPSLVVDSCIRLSKELPWLKVKTDSSQSFPGDHATTALLFAVGFSFFAKRKLAIAACLYSAFLCMPRMIVGAHWLTDVVIGSGSIVTLFFAWAFCTPFSSIFIKNLEKLLYLFQSSFRKARSLLLATKETPS